MLEPTFVDTALVPELGQTVQTVLDLSDKSALDTLYGAALGPVSIGYYLRLFARSEVTGRGGASWNWAASLGTLNWMVFRQLWWAALAYLLLVPGLALLVFGLGRLLFQTSVLWELEIALTLVAMLFLVPGLWGNTLLYAHCCRQVAHALEETSTRAEAAMVLKRRAGTRQRLAWLALANAALAGAAVGVWIGLPGSTRPPLATVPATAASSTAAATIAPVPHLPLVPAPIPPQPPAAASAQGLAPAALSAPTRLASASASASAPSDPTVTAASSKANAHAAPGFYINVGLFAQVSNARAAHAKLLDAGLPAFTQAIDSPKGKRTRVRVGPFDSRAQAEAAAARIQALTLDAVLFRL